MTITDNDMPTNGITTNPLYPPPPPAAKTDKNPLVECPVPGCMKEPMRQNALGPHVAMHRRHGDPGTPPAKWAKRKTTDTDAPKARKPRPIVKLTPSDVVDGVLRILYPEGVIPLDRIRAVSNWVSETERLASEAFADRIEP